MKAKDTILICKRCEIWTKNAGVCRDCSRTPKAGDGTYILVFAAKRTTR